MAQLSLIEVFEDCVQRLTTGDTIERCLLLYPAYAEQLQPMLETVVSFRGLQVPQGEIYQDQALVWDVVQRRIAQQGRRRRISPGVQLLAAVVVLMLMLSAAWFALTRPELPPQVDALTPFATTETPSPSPTPTASATLSLTPSPTISPTLSATPSLTATSSITPSPSATVTATQTASVTPSPTASPTASITPTLSATFAPGCGVPFTAAQAIARVLEVFPNASVIGILQTTKLGGTLVWEVRLTGQIVVDVDVACGTILTIDRGETQAGTGDNANSNDNGGSGDSNTNTSGNANSNENANENTNDNTNANEDNSNDDGSGMGSGD